MESSSNIDRELDAYDRGKAAEKLYILDLLKELIDNAKSTHSARFVMGLEAALERVEDFG